MQTEEFIEAVQHELPPPFTYRGVPSQASVRSFREYMYTHYEKNGRSFPWRETCDPYRILLSEMMLQQTQTQRVLKKYSQFLHMWPALSDLSQASLTDILTLWSGLGYNRRALALKKIAEISIENYQGGLPGNQEELLKLPMVGQATSAAILAFAFNKPSLYLETNIRRVLLYFFFSGREGVKDRELYPVLERVLDHHDPKRWYYALMDYGVLLKGLIPNPNRRSAHYARQAPFENSNRQVRGEILTLLTSMGRLSAGELQGRLAFPEEQVAACLQALEREGFLSMTCAELEPEYKIR
ncbi:MAG: hypothetical protein ACQEQU_05975 [Spirochaetota bacterium]